MNKNNAVVCPTCTKTVKSLSEIVNCYNCRIMFCKKHAKQGKKNQILCRQCFTSEMKKKLIKENLGKAIQLNKELKNIKQQQTLAKLKLEKKIDTKKRLASQLNELKKIHIENVESLKERIKFAINSNKSIENTIASLKNAFLDMQNCESQKKLEFETSSQYLDSLVFEKLTLQNEVNNLVKRIEKTTEKKKLYIKYSKLRLFCCLKCIEKIKSVFKKQLMYNLKGQKSLIRSLSKSKSSVKSLPGYPSDSCNCIMF